MNLRFLSCEIGLVFITLCLKSHISANPLITSTPPVSVTSDSREGKNYGQGSMEFHLNPYDPVTWAALKVWGHLFSDKKQFSQWKNPIPNENQTTIPNHNDSVDPLIEETLHEFIFTSSTVETDNFEINSEVPEDTFTPIYPTITNEPIQPVAETDSNLGFSQEPIPVQAATMPPSGSQGQLVTTMQTPIEINPVPTLKPPALPTPDDTQPWLPQLGSGIPGTQLIPRPPGSQVGPLPVVPQKPPSNHLFPPQPPPSQLQPLLPPGHHQPITSPGLPLQPGAGQIHKPSPYPIGPQNPPHNNQPPIQFPGGVQIQYPGGMQQYPPYPGFPQQIPTYPGQQGPNLGPNSGRPQTLSHSSIPSDQYPLHQQNSPPIRDSEATPTLIGPIAYISPYTIFRAPSLSPHQSYPLQAQRPLLAQSQLPKFSMNSESPNMFQIPFSSIRPSDLSETSLNERFPLMSILTKEGTLFTIGNANSNSTDLPWQVYLTPNMDLYLRPPKNLRTPKEVTSTSPLEATREIDYPIGISAEAISSETSDDTNYSEDDENSPELNLDSGSIWTPLTFRHILDIGSKQGEETAQNEFVELAHYILHNNHPVPSENRENISYIPFISNGKF